MLLSLQFKEPMKFVCKRLAVKIWTKKFYLKLFVKKMAPPKKQKREYTAGEYVWVKIKGYPIWPGQVITSSSTNSTTQIFFYFHNY